MKKLLLTSLTTITFLISNLAISQCCTYTLNMFDSYGDGWNGGQIDIIVNGTVVINNAFASGSSSAMFFDACNGQTVQFNYTSGSWETENSFNITNSSGTIVYSDAASIAVGTYSIGPFSCPQTCFDGIQNQNETSVDCGGVCVPCECSDGIQNNGETGIDCGGPCPNSCPEPCTVEASYSIAGTTCNYSIQMNDSWGDGWNGGFLSVYIGGVLIGTYSASGTGSTASFTANAGQTISVTYSSGSFESENSYTITDCDGAVVVSGGPSPATGTVYSGIVPGVAGLDCNGGDVQLIADGQGAFSYVMNNTFDTGGAGTGWQATSAAQFNNPCNPSFDGGSYMWMGSTSPAPRALTTIPVDVSCGGQLCFYFDMATQAAASPCEGPDEPDEGVYLQYSINGGATWVVINYFDPLGGYDPIMTSWNEYCFDIPAAAMTTNTMFQWSQTATTSNLYDHWGVDNVYITSLMNCDPYVYDWWQVPGGDNNPSQTQTVTQTTTYTVVYTNGTDMCTTDVTVVVPPGTTADAGPDYTICQGDPAVTIGANPVTPDNGATYSWNNGAGSGTISLSGGSQDHGQATVSPGTTTEYILSVSFNGCDMEDTVMVIVNPPPIINAGSDVAICDGESSTLTASGGVNYSWSPATGLDVTTGPTVVATPAVTTVYTVTGTDINGCVNTDQVTVTISTQDDPTFVLTDFCLGSANSATGIVTPGGTFSFSPAPGDGAIINASTGSISNATGGATYSVQYLTNGVCPNSLILPVTVNPLPVIVVNDVSVCLGGSVDITASGANSYSWSPGTYLNQTTGPTVTSTPAADITYTVTGTSTVGCVSSAPVNVTVSGNAAIDAGSDVTICDGGSTILTASGGVSYTWDDGSMTPNPGVGNNFNVSPTVTTTYTVVGQDANGCFGQDDMTVTVNPIPTVDPVSDQTLCEGTATSTVVFTGLEPGTTYDWSMSADIGAGTSGTGDIASFTTTSSTTATVTVTPTLNGCTGTAITFDIIVNPIPTVDPVLDQTICEGTNTVDVLFTGSLGAGATYDWTNTNGSIGLAGVGTGDILSFAGQNGGSSAISGDIVVTPSAAGCIGTPISFTITVNPLPEATIGSDATICEGAAGPVVSFTGSNSPGEFDFAYTLNTVAQTPLTSTGGAASITAPNTPAGTYTYELVSVTDVNTGCSQAQTGTAVITVNPIPTVDAVTSQVLCEPDATADIIFTGSEPTAIYSWTNSNTNIGIGASGTGDILSFLGSTNGTNVQQVGTIDVTPSANGCIGLPIQFTITVNPIPAVDPVADQVLCSNPITTAVTFTGPVAGTVYDWVMSDDIGYAMSGTGNIPSFSAVNGTSSTIVSTVTITPTAGCSGPSIQFTYTVFPIPTIDPIADQVLCSNQPTTAVNFTGPVVGTTFGWTNSNTNIGLGANGSGNTLASFSATAGSSQEVGTITVTPTANGCSGAPAIFTITVNPLPMATIGSDASLCEGDAAPTITFTGSNSGGEYTFSYNINGTAQPNETSTGGISTVTGPNTPVGTYNYNLVSVSDVVTGCAQAQGGTAVITVNPNPTPVINGATEYCMGQFSTLSTTQAYTSYDWSTGANTPTINVTDADNPITVTVENAFGCFGTSAVFTVMENAVITYNSTVEICQGDVAIIHGNPETVAGVYSQTFILPTGCDSTSNVTLVVHALPAVSAGADQTVCENINVTLSGSGATSYVWSPLITNGSPFLPPLGTTTYTVTGTDGFGCENTDQVDVTVNEIPVLTQEPDQTLCNGTATAAVNFVSSVPSTFAWTNSNTSIGLASPGSGNIPSFTASNGGTSQISGTISVVPTANNCPGTPMVFAINVNPTPQLQQANNQTICSNTSTAAVNFISSVAGSGFTWSNDNTNIGLGASGVGNIPAFTGTNPPPSTTAITGNITVTPTASGCQGPDMIFSITINPIPQVLPIANQTLCNGTATAAVDLQSGVAGTTFTWSNSNTNIGLGASGSSDPIPSFTATNAPPSGSPIMGTITVTPMANTCQGPTGQFTITVNPTPTVNAIADQSWCAGSASTQVNIGGSVAGATYDWTNNNVNTGLAASGQNTVPSFITTAGSTPEVSVITITPTANGCSGPTEDFTITVNPIPTVNPQLDQTICEGTQTALVDFTGNILNTTYNWTNNTPSIGLAGAGSGDINPFTGSTADVPTIGTITVIPTYNGCTGTSDQFTITVNPTPTVNAVNNQTVCSGDMSGAVNFGGAVASTNFTWSLNNPNIGLNPTSGTGNIPQFQTTNPGPGAIVGTFTVTPDAAGCPGPSTNFTITVNPLPSATIVGDAEVCLGSVPQPVVTFTGSNGLGNYIFTYTVNGVNSTNITSSGSNASVNASNAAPGTFDYVLTNVEDATTGCSMSLNEMITIIVNPLPTATISGNVEVCLNANDQTITFTGAGGSGGPYTFNYTSSSGNGSITSTGTTATITVPATTVGDFSFTLVSVTDNVTGCSQFQSGLATVSVNPIPNVFAGNDVIICEGESVVLTASGANFYVWESPATQAGAFTPAATDTYTVVGTDGNGCANIDSVTVIVDTAPNVSFTADTTIGCAPLTVTFTNTTPGVDFSNCIWTLSNGTILNGCGSVTYVFEEGGTYDVTLQLENENGCEGSTTYTNYIYVENPPIASFVPSQTILSTLNTEVIFLNTSVGASDYVWDFGDGTGLSTEINPLHVYPDDISETYGITLIAYSPLGCTDTAYLTIRINEEVIFYVPNTFTPDDDDYNPIFLPIFTSGYDPFDYTLLIFNRWGEVVFESHNTEVGWDATYGTGDNRKFVQDGTYTWVIEFKTTATDERVRYTGHVNVLR